MSTKWTLVAVKLCACVREMFSSAFRQGVCYSEAFHHFIHYFQASSVILGHYCFHPHHIQPLIHLLYISAFQSICGFVKQVARTTHVLGRTRRLLPFFFLTPFYLQYVLVYIHSANWEEALSSALPWLLGLGAWWKYLFPRERVYRFIA
jgi:hypothetical protein